MKRIIYIQPPEPIKVTLVHRYSFKGQLHRIVKHLITVLMLIFLLMIVAPANAADSGKDKNSKCRARTTGFSYPVITKKKNKPVSYKRHKKLSRAKRMPFLV